MEVKPNNDDLNEGNTDDLVRLIAVVFFFLIINNTIFLPHLLFYFTCMGLWWKMEGLVYCPFLFVPPHGLYSHLQFSIPF